MEIKLEVVFRTVLFYIVYFSITAILVTTYGYPLNIPILAIASFGFSLLFAFVYLVKKHRMWVEIFCITAYLIAVVALLQDLLYGVRLCLNYAIIKINHTGEYIDTIKATSFDNSNYFFYLVILFFMGLLGALLFFSIVIKNNLLLVLLITVPLMEIGFYYSLFPNIIFFVTLLLGYTMLMFTRVTQKSTSSENVVFLGSSRTLKKSKQVFSLCFSVFFLLLFSLSIYLLPIEEYGSFLAKLSFREPVAKTANMAAGILLPNEEPKEAAGGLSEGKLSAVDEIQFKGETDLKVKLKKVNNAVYLKGYVGAFYEDNTWTGLSRDEEIKYETLCANLTESPHTFSNQLLLFDQAVNSPLFRSTKTDIKIQTIHANSDYTYLPYNLTTASLQEMNQEDDLQLKEKDKEENGDTLSFFDIVNYDNSLFLHTKEDIEKTYLNRVNESNGNYERAEVETYFNEEGKYQDYVYQTYTKLPEKDLSKLYQKYSYLTEQTSNTGGIIKRIVADVKKAAVYTLSPGKTPEDKDFIEYFLLENKKGYCVHFATAAVILFRMAGIPSRYVEGYIITQENYNSAEAVQDGIYDMEIKDYNAHAWVEIYLDGYGWVPVEVTPGYSTFGVNESLQGTINKVTYEESAKSDNKIAPTEEIKESPKVKTPKKEDGKEKDVNENTKQTALPVTANHVGWLLGLLGLLMVVVILLRRKLILTIRKKRSIKMDVDQKIISLYNAVNRLFEYQKYDERKYVSRMAYAKAVEEGCHLPEAGDFSEMTRAALKAAYAKGQSKETDCSIMKQKHNEIVGYFYKKLSWSKKILYKYIKVFI